MSPDERLPEIKGFKSLIAWQKGMRLVVEVYKLTALYPKYERFGLCMQSQKAAVGIPSNVAEGYGRRTRADYVHFLDIARGSANELETQVLVAIAVKHVSQGQAQLVLDLVTEEQRILKGLVVKVEASDKTSVRNEA